MRLGATGACSFGDRRFPEEIRVVREKFDARSSDPNSPLMQRLAEIEAKSFPGDAWSAHTIASYARDGGLWVARDTIGGEVAGFIVSRVHGGVATLADMAVDPAHRRKGIGEKLMTAAMKQAKADGATKARLHVEAQNLGAKRLYEKLGFETLSVCRNFYSGGRDGLLMEAPL
jgi:[ribosomal protein S18]-alanine N-acetyltransferase